MDIQGNCETICHRSPTAHEIIGIKGTKRENKVDRRRETRSASGGGKQGIRGGERVKHGRNRANQIHLLHQRKNIAGRVLSFWFCHGQCKPRRSRNTLFSPQPTALPHPPFSISTFLVFIASFFANQFLLLRRLFPFLLVLWAEVRMTVKKMRRVAEEPSPSASFAPYGDDARKRFRFQSLSQDYTEFLEVRRLLFNFVSPWLRDVVLFYSLLILGFRESCVN